jgi:hypothetical protein
MKAVSNRYYSDQKCILCDKEFVVAVFSLLSSFCRMGEVGNAYNILVGKPDGKRPLGRPTRRWEDNIIMDLRKI